MLHITKQLIIKVLDFLNIKAQTKSFLKSLQLFGFPKVQPIILDTIEHDSNAFTQGLVFFDHRIYESTGLEGQSSLRCINPKTGKIEKKIRLDKDWGEGIAIYNDSIVQLTWKSELAHIYSLSDFRKLGEFYYKGEGWGLTSGFKENHFIMSNGTDLLSIRNHEFKEINTINVLLRGTAITNINDLVFAQDKVYANILNENLIYQISAYTGKVEKIIDCSEIVKQAQIQHSDHVLNGIAYDKDKKIFYLTGKNWQKIFKVSFPE